MKSHIIAWLFCGFLCSGAFAQDRAALDKLADDYWSWRASEQPFGTDDIPRLDRPAGWKADWSASGVSKYRAEAAAFERRWQQVGSGWNSRSRTDEVDYRLMGSAISRAVWELEYLRGWERNPWFYLDQTVGSVFVLMLQPPPFTPERSAELIRRVRAFPELLAAGKDNLTTARAPFAQLALAELKELQPKLDKVVAGLRPLLAAKDAAALDSAMQQAISALNDYRAWLQQRLPMMTNSVAVGRPGYEYFLRNVALLPYSPEQLIGMSRQEWSRAVALEAYDKQRNASLPEMPIFKDQAAQILAEEKDEGEIRAYLEKNNIMTVPAWVQHYRNLPLPPYLGAINEFGVTDDLTGPTRLKENATSYIGVPSPSMGYFGASTARDPQPIIIHEGIPGHYFQKVMSWTNEDPIRRHYYDSSANEGIGFYAEEMMMRAGLFEDSPRSREIIDNFMRFRALRVEVDVKIATGEFTIEQAAAYFEKMVPLDHATAMEDSTFYAATPGVGIAYQTGKLQITAFLAAARLKEGKDFSLRRFHDSLYKNGNVPIALQEYEYLGDSSLLPATPRTGATQ